MLTEKTKRSPDERHIKEHKKEITRHFDTHGGIYHPKEGEYKI